MSKLERSFMFLRKMNFNKNDEVPTQTEIRLQLGDELAQLLFKSTDPYIRELLGCDCTLTGPGEELWVSPSDLLIGCTKLKPPLTSKYIQALTHEGILKIGAEIEEKFKKMMEERQRIALKANTERLKYLFARMLKKACEDVRREEQCKHWVEIMLLHAEFELRLKEELEKLRQELTAQKEIEVLQGKLEMKKLMQKKVEEVVNVTVSRLIEEYGIVLREQSVKWHEHFNFHLKLAEERLQVAVANETIRCNDEFRSLYTELKCNFIANMMHVTCTERRKAETEKLSLQKDYDEKLKILETRIKEMQELLDEYTNASSIQTRQIEKQEEVLYKIIKEFQRFIYFVLRAEPQQAEYLLNIEKLMIFELTKTIMEKQPELFRECSIYEAGRKEDSISTPTTVSDSLTIKDYHKHDNIEAKYSDTHTLSSNEDLPGFVFGEKIFIREDFRNMISQGLRISRSNHYWNWDIEDLQKHLTMQHGVCLQDRPSADTLEPCHKSSFVVCNKQLPDHRSRFYHPCIGICEGNKTKVVKQKKSDDLISRSTYSFTCKCVDHGNVSETTKEPDELINVKWERESKNVPSEEAVVKPYDRTKKIGLSDSCVSCNILGAEAISRKKDGVCDCLPKMETPSLAHIEQITNDLIEQLEVTGEDFDLPCPIDTIKPSTKTPLHHTLDSNELIRRSQKKSDLSVLDEYESDSYDIDVKRNISFQTKSKLALFARDSLTISRMNLNSKKCVSRDVSMGSQASSNEIFSDFLGQLTTFKSTAKRKSSVDRTVKIKLSFEKPKKEGEDEHGVMFKSDTPKIIPSRLSSDVITTTKKESTLGPHVNEHVQNFVKSISSDVYLRSLFKG